MNFNNFFENNESIVLCVNKSTKEIIEANKSAIDFYGYLELKSMNIDDINMSNDIVNKEVTYFSHKLKNGKVKKVKINASDIIMNDINASLLIVTDISKEYELQEALDSNKKLNKDIFNSFPHMISVKDKEGKYLLCNNKFEDYFGVNEKYIIGKSDYDFLSPFTATLNQNTDTITMVKDTAYTKESWVAYPSGRHFLLSNTKIPLNDSFNGIIGILTIGKDVTKQKFDEEQLDLFANIFKSTKEGILITDNKCNIIDVNEAFSKITGYTKDEVIGRNPSILKSGFHNENFYEYMWNDINSLGFWSGEIINKRKNGNTFNELLTINVIKDEKGDNQYYFALFSDISLIKQNEKTLENLAHYDSLTSLPNRILLEDRIHQNIYNARRIDNTFALAFLDLDGFKNINDVHGHDIGDKVLIYISTLLERTLRQSDTVSRHGGDEFILILSNLTSLENIHTFFTTILKHVANPFFIGDIKIEISASIGIIVYDKDVNYSPEILLRKADDAMYKAKNLGKNRYFQTS